MTNCTAYRQQDEMYCPTCDRRWHVTDDWSPDCVTNAEARDKPIIIGIAGAAGSGKTTVAEHLVLQHRFTHIKFAGPLKSMMHALLEEAGCGEWSTRNTLIEGDAKESPAPVLSHKSPRHAMQTLGTEWGRKCMGEDFWVNIARARINAILRDDPRARIVIDDVRFDNEARMVTEVGGTFVQLVGRGGIDGSHASESSLVDERASCIYRNDGTIVELNGWFVHVFDL